MSNKVYILSGCSGSGKTSFAYTHAYGNDRGEVLCPEWLDKRYVISTDEFFVHQGIYQFDPAKLGEAHAACMQRFVLLVTTNKPIIIVDNSNTTTEEIAPYYSVARAFGYEVELVTTLCDPIVAYERCVHNVPLGTIRAQVRRINERFIPRNWEMKCRHIYTN